MIHLQGSNMNKKLKEYIEENYRNTYLIKRFFNAIEPAAYCFDELNTHPNEDTGLDFLHKDDKINVKISIDLVQ